MDLPGPPARPAASRAPGNGLKLMLAILVVFAILAAYGVWEHSRREKTEIARVIPAASVAPSPNNN